MNSRRLPGRLLVVAVVLAVAGAIAWGLAPRPVPVDVRIVGRGPLAVRVADDGVTRIRERHLVRAPLAGRMGRVGLHPGDEVAAAETVITTIDPPDPALLDPRAEADALARVETARAIQDLAEQALARARVQEEYTAADLERAKELFPTKAVTHEQLDAAERAWKTAVDDATEAEEEIHVAKHLVEVTEAALVRSRPARAGGPRPGAGDWRLDVTPPIDGRVSRASMSRCAICPAVRWGWSGMCALVTTSSPIPVAGSVCGPMLRCRRERPCSRGRWRPRLAVGPA